MIGVNYGPNLAHSQIIFVFGNIELDVEFHAQDDS